MLQFIAGSWKDIYPYFSFGHLRRTKSLHNTGAALLWSFCGTADTVEVKIEVQCMKRDTGTFFRQGSRGIMMLALRSRRGAGQERSWTCSYFAWQWRPCYGRGSPRGSLLGRSHCWLWTSNQCPNLVNHSRTCQVVLNITIVSDMSSMTQVILRT